MFLIESYEFLWESYQNPTERARIAQGLNPGFLDLGMRHSENLSIVVFKIISSQILPCYVYLSITVIEVGTLVDSVENSISLQFAHKSGLVWVLKMSTKNRKYRGEELHERLSFQQFSKSKRVHFCEQSEEKYHFPRSLLAYLLQLQLSTGKHSMVLFVKRSCKKQMQDASMIMKQWDIFRKDGETGERLEWTLVELQKQADEKITLISVSISNWERIILALRIENVSTL